MDKSKIKINIEDYENDYSLKGIFIKLVTNSKKISEENKNEVIITGIKALGLEEVD